jgi:chemotaxis protein histidine kinase CheA
VDIAFGQLPTKVSLRGRAHRLAYRPVLEGEALVGVVVCVQDASAEETIESMLRGQRELFRLATRAVRDPAGLREFLEEGRRLLADLRDGRAGPADQLGLLHTLKGNAALLGLERVGELCHALETRAETGPLRAEDLEPLVAAWSELDQRARSMLGRQRATLEVSRADRDALLAAIAEGAPPDALRSLVEAWDLEPVERRFERLADQARTLASRLGRGPLEVEIAARGVRLPAEGFAEFWSALAHIVRNAVDHGIEPAPERLRLGKPHRGRLRFEAEKLGGDRVLITLTDDGRGVDWAALRRKAQRRGQTPDLPRSELFFLGGLSSRDEVSLSSGRGVGTSAVARVVDALGGRCQVWSATGEGTTLEFVLPVHRPAAAPDAPSELGR